MMPRPLRYTKVEEQAGGGGSTLRDTHRIGCSSCLPVHANTLQIRNVKRPDVDELHRDFALAIQFECAPDTHTDTRTESEES